MSDAVSGSYESNSDPSIVVSEKEDKKDDIDDIVKDIKRKISMALIGVEEKPNQKKRMVRVVRRILTERGFYLPRHSSKACNLNYYRNLINRKIVCLENADKNAAPRISRKVSKIALFHILDNKFKGHGFTVRTLPGRRYLLDMLFKYNPHNPFFNNPAEAEFSTAFEENSEVFQGTEWDKVKLKVEALKDDIPMRIKLCNNLTKIILGRITASHGLNMVNSGSNDIVGLINTEGISTSKLIEGVVKGLEDDLAVNTDNIFN